MRRKFEEGRAFADESQKSSPKDPYAAVALAEIALLTKDYPVAIKHLEQVHSAENPHPLVLRRLAQAKLQSRDFPGAAVLFQLGTEKDPDNKAWWQGLAACYLGVDEQEKLTPVLEHLAELDYDSPGPRLKLAQQALARGDYAQTIRSARQVLYISVMDAEAHALLAQGYAGLNQWDRALTEWVITHAVDQEQEDALAAFEKLPEEIPADQRASVYKVASELAREFDDLPAVKTLAEALTD